MVNKKLKKIRYYYHKQFFLMISRYQFWQDELPFKPFKPFQSFNYEYKSTPLYQLQHISLLRDDKHQIRTINLQKVQHTDLIHLSCEIQYSRLCSFCHRVENSLLIYRFLHETNIMHSAVAAKIASDTYNSCRSKGSGATCYARIYNYDTRLHSRSRAGIGHQ